VLKVAVTGNICSGKTTVSEIIKDEGIPVVSCDQLVKSCQSPGNILWREIKNRWGKKYIKNDGSLDRKKLSEDLLNRPEFKKELEDISHPVIKQEMLKILDTWRAEGAEIACAEVPLLFESGWRELFDRVITTAAPEEVRIKRIMSVRKVDRAAAFKWINAQMAQEEKIKMSDYVIETNEPLEKTRQKVNEIIRKLKEERI